MSRKLPENTVLSFSEGDIGAACKVQIRHSLGEGSTCCVYLADRTAEDGTESKQVILKEFCPAVYFIDSPCVTRGTDNNEYELNVPASLGTDFYDRMEIYRKACLRFYNYLQKNPSFLNNHCMIRGIYSLNGTVYVLNDVAEGESYFSMEKRSPSEEIETIIKISKVVSFYHKNEMLHLDLKPQNIIITPGGQVKIIDIDSLVNIEDVKNALIPVNNFFFVPETDNTITRNIGTSTDIFEIASMLYYKLLGERATSDMFSHYYKFEKSPVLNKLDDLGLIAKNELGNLFNNTLRISPIDRISCINNFISRLKTVLTLITIREEAK